MPTLLLADDSLTVQRVVALTFANENITVTAVNDGEEAIARIAKDHPDIVLAAIATPRRSGYDVAAFVKSHPELASIPVLLVAGAFESVDQVRAQQVRCDGVLVKPLEPQQVLARVKELIGRANSGADQAVSPGPARDPLLDAYFERLDAAIATRAPFVAASRPDTGETVPTLESVLDPAAAKDPAAPAVTEALVDAVTRRVVERLGSQALREVVADVVAETAERLIREEIARIRNKQ